MTFKSTFGSLFVIVCFREFRRFWLECSGPLFLVFRLLTPWKSMSCIIVMNCVFRFYYPRDQEGNFIKPSPFIPVMDRVSSVRCLNNSLFNLCFVDLNSRLMDCPSLLYRTFHLCPDFIR